MSSASRVDKPGGIGANQAVEAEVDLTETVARVYGEYFTNYAYTFAKADIYYSGDNANVALTYGLSDLVDFSTRKFVKNVTVLGSTGEAIGISNPAVPRDNRIKASVYHGDTGKEFRVVEGGSGTNGSDKNSVFAEIWRGDVQLYREAIPGCKDVYQSSVFGSPVWSSDGNFIAIVAEPSDPKFSRGWWSTAKPGEAKGQMQEEKQQVSSKEKAGGAEDKFLLRPDFGETLTKTQRPVVIIFDTVKRSYVNVSDEIVKSSPNLSNIIFSFPTFLPHGNGLLLVGYSMKSKLHIPGLSRCFNRESQIYYIENLKDISNSPPKVITSNMYMSLCPIVNSSGNQIVFAGHKDEFGAHATQLDLYSLTWPWDGVSLPRRLAIPETRSDTGPATYNGLYLSSQAESSQLTFLPQNLGDDVLVVPTFTSGRAGVFLVDTRKEKILYSIVPPPFESGKSLVSTVLLATSGSDVVVLVQGYTTPKSVWRCRLERSNNGVYTGKYTEVFKSPDPPKEILSAKLEIVTVSNCTAFLVSSGGTGRPLIANLHGGPHMGAISAFNADVTAFVMMGYDVVLPNYRGSFSFGRDFVHALPGNIGDMDVLDSHECAVTAAAKLGSSTIVAYGGSHGGFLAGWLVGHPKTKDTYTCGVLWNPAVDILSLNLTSDIPDWAICEAIGEKKLSAHSLFTASPDFVTDATAKSPMSVVANVTVPCCVILGSSDKRVPPYGGLRWAQAIESRGGNVKVLWYPEQGHAVAGPELNENAIVNVGLYIASHLKRDKKC